MVSTPQGARALLSRSAQKFARGAVQAIAVPAEQTPQDSELTTPGHYKRLARHLRAKATRAREDAARWEAQAADFDQKSREEAEARERRLIGGHRQQGLHERPPISTVDTVEVGEERAIAHARGQVKRLKAQGRSVDPLTVAALKAGFSGFRGLSRELKVGKSMMGKYRAGSKIPRSLAKKIEKLTGFAATPANWPGGFKDE